MKAIEEVANAIPKDASDILRQKFCTGKVSWFIPSHLCNGFVEKLPPGDVIYLSPLLELYSDKAIKGAVAHELAHLHAGHLKLPGEARGEATETEADELAIKWGFEKELAAHTREFKQLLPAAWRLLNKGLEVARSEG